MAIEEAPPADSSSQATALPASLRLPDRSILVHIGPHKTGTTSVQAAFHADRKDLAHQGVTYAGRGTKAGDAVRAVLGMRRPSGAVPSIGVWRALVDEATRAPGRAVISNEFLSEASPEAIRAIARDLGPERIQVVATLRPLDRILPSQWQQFVQGGAVKPFDVWLEDVLRGWATPTDRFWRRHRHDLVVARWAEVVGPRRVTVIAVDERDPAQLFRVFEELVGLRSHSLTPVKDVRNRSMTWPEIEVVRALNVATKAQGMASHVHYRLIERGACEAMKRRVPELDEPRVQLPDSASERVAEIARSILDGIRASGANIVGDLETLAVPRAERAAGVVAPTCIEPEVSAALSMGVLEAIDALPGRAAAATAEPRLAGVPAGRIAAAIGRRPARVAIAGLRRVVGRPGRDRRA